METMSPNNASEVRSIRKWFLVALILSLALHGVLYEFFRSKQLERFAFSGPTERLIPRAFTVKKVTINEDLLKPAATPDPKKVEPPKTVLQNEKPDAESLPTDVRLTPNAPAGSEMAKAIATEKPHVEAGKIPSPESNAQVERELDSIHSQIASKNAPKIVAGEGGGIPDSKQNGHDDPGAAGYSNIDNLLAQSGPLTGKVAPVNMPGGALFEYDSAILRGNAIETLRKLGTLIERNPRSTFSIEGYADSFGTPDYNKKLSTARAEAVKAWLIANMKLDPSKIHAQGFGSSHFIAPVNGTREEQAPNRRVEIVIRTPKD
jgi:outer membrane protein OmpA-like peptidoglycan-associated protein